MAVLLCVTPLACRQSAKQTIAQKNKDLPAYIIFGRFCGECSGHCATMYRYKVTNNSDRLFVDSTDSYFRNHGKVLCNTPVKDTGKFRIVDILVQHIPAAFTNKRLAKYWLDEKNKTRNEVSSAFYPDVKSIDTVYYAGATYCPYLLVTKKDDSQFKVCVNGERQEIKSFFDEALNAWTKNKTSK